MLPNIRNVRWLVLTGLVVASAASAESGSATGTAETRTDASAAAHAASASAGAATQTHTDLDASLRAERDAIEKKAARVSAKVRAQAEARLAACADQVDAAVKKQGEAAVAGRLSSELGIDAGVLMAEQDELECGWGDLMIAHVLDANAKTDLSAAQLVKLNDAGCEWSDVAAGLGIDLNAAVRGLSGEARVAAGLARGDGRVAVMSGTGARAGATAGVGTGVRVGDAGAGVNAGVGVGLTVGKK